LTKLLHLYKSYTYILIHKLLPIGPVEVGILW